MVPAAHIHPSPGPRSSFLSPKTSRQHSPHPPGHRQSRKTQGSIVTPSGEGHQPISRAPKAEEPGESFLSLPGEAGPFQGSEVKWKEPESSARRLEWNSGQPRQMPSPVHVPGVAEHENKCGEEHSSPPHHRQPPPPPGTLPNATVRAGKPDPAHGWEQSHLTVHCDLKSAPRELLWKGNPGPMLSEEASSHTPNKAALQIWMLVIWAFLKRPQLQQNAVSPAKPPGAPGNQNPDKQRRGSRARKVGHCTTQLPILSWSVQVLIHCGNYPQQIAIWGQPGCSLAQGVHLEEPQHPATRCSML